MMAFLESVGFAPIRIRREVEGFAMNRLQSALLREAYRLVDAGIVDVEGADRLVSEALGPRNELVLIPGEGAVGSLDVLIHTVSLAPTDPPGRSPS